MFAIALGAFFGCGTEPADLPKQPKVITDRPTPFEVAIIRLEHGRVPIRSAQLHVDPESLGAKTGLAYSAQDHPIDIEVFVFADGAKTRQGLKHSQASGWKTRNPAELFVRGPVLLRIRTQHGPNTPAGYALRDIVGAFGGEQ